MMLTLDDIRGRATISIPEAGQLLGIGRDAAYIAADRGQIPTLQLSRSRRVPVPKLLELLGVHVDSASAEPASGPALTSTMPASPGSHDHDDAQPTAASSIRRVSGL